MKKQAVVIDSTVYLTEEEISKYNLSVVSLNIVAGTESFREVDIDNDFVFDKQDQGFHLTTSQPSPGEFLKVYEGLLDKGYEKIFVIGLSSAISGTYQSANLAKNMLKNPEQVHVFDTLLAAFGVEMVVLKLCRLIEEGNTNDVIIRRITDILDNAGQMFTVENLFHLAKGGRLSKTSATIGTVLRVKPIIRVLKGKLELVNKERTYSKLHKYMVASINEMYKKGDKLTIRITNTNSLDSANVLKEVIETSFPEASLEISHYLGPVFSIHVGPKGYGISWYTEKSK